jgi:ribonuclease HI
VKGFVGAQHKKFSDRGEAEAFAGLTQSSLAVPTEKSSSKGAHLLRPSPYSRPEKAGPQAKNQDADVLTSQSDWDVVYTDGACQGNGKKNIQPLAGIGVWWGPHDPRWVTEVIDSFLADPLDLRNIAERCPGEQTNNRAELVVRTPKLARTEVNTQQSIPRLSFEHWRLPLPIFHL